MPKEVLVSRILISIDKNNIDCAFTELQKHLSSDEDKRLAKLNCEESKKLSGNDRYDEQYKILHKNNIADIDFTIYPNNGEISIEIAGLEEIGFPNYYAENLVNKCKGRIINSSTYNIK
jgi:hypothetical protein